MIFFTHSLFGALSDDFFPNIGKNCFKFVVDFAKEGKRAIVPMHNKDIPKGTLYTILKQAGIEKEGL